MARKLHIIYIPGLDDHNDARGQRLAVGLWRVWGVSSEVWQIHWDDKENAWEAKLAQLTEYIDKLRADGTPVALVAASAGACAAINLFAIRREAITGLVLIAPKVNHPETIETFHNDKHPSFVTAAHACPAALATLDAEDRQRIFTYYALNDRVLTAQDSEVPGAHNTAVASLPHPLVIAGQLVFGAPRFLRLLRQLPPK